MHVPPPAPVSDAPAPLDPPRERVRAWLVLAALGLRLRHAPVVERLGGPIEALALPAQELASAVDLRGFQKRPPDEQARAHADAHAGEALRWLDERGGQVLLPRELACLEGMASSPLVLFTQGDPTLLSRRPSLAVVGSRAATDRGLERARALAEAAARAGVMVVSGGALGVDLAAHRGALNAGGATVVVLGDALRAGHDERPSRVRALSGDGERLLTLTPHGPWAPRDKRLWASRNAVIATLADVVVVIEGRARSGTLYTAEAARKLGRPILAVPGDPDDEVAAAPNQLLREASARPLLSIDDAIAAVLSESGRSAPRAGVRAPTQPSLPLPVEPALPDDERALLHALGPRGSAADVEEVAAKLGLTTTALFGPLLQLELRGLVRRQGASLLRVG